MDPRLVDRIGAYFCWIYAIAWLVVSQRDLMPAVLVPIMEWPPHGRFIPASIGGAFLFAAAPVMRKQERNARLVFALGTALIVSPGAWLALQGTVSAGAIVLWLIVPMGIAVWVAIGSPDSLEVSPDRRETSPVGYLIVIGVLLFAVLLWAMVMMFTTPFP